MYVGYVMFLTIPEILWFYWLNYGRNRFYCVQLINISDLKFN